MKSLKLNLSKAAATALTLIASAGASHAASFSYQGNFINDDDLAVFNLHLSSATTLSAFTLGWGGGTDSHGQPVKAGGFAPVLALYDSAGSLLQLSVGSRSTCGPSSGLPSGPSGACWDARMEVDLTAGDFKLIETQDGNLPSGDTLADGYSMAGQTSYTGVNYLGDPGRRFVNIDGTLRTSRWTLDVVASDLTVTPAVPEPASSMLLLIGCGAIAFRARGRFGGTRQGA